MRTLCLRTPVRRTSNWRHDHRILRIRPAAQPPAACRPEPRRTGHLGPGRDRLGRPPSHTRGWWPLDHRSRRDGAACGDREPPPPRRLRRHRCRSSCLSGRRRTGGRRLDGHGGRHDAAPGAAPVTDGAAAGVPPARPLAADDAERHDVRRGVGRGRSRGRPGRPGPPGTGRHRVVGQRSPLGERGRADRGRRLPVHPLEGPVPARMS